MNVFNKSYAIILMMILTLLCVTAVFSNGNDTLHSQVNDFHVFLPIVHTPEPPPDTITLVEYIAPLPGDTITVITHAGDDRIFIATQKGRISIIDPDPSGLSGTVREIPFMHIGGRIEVSFEEGLLGLAFDPDFEESGYFYVAYSEKRTNPTDGGDLILARFKVRFDNPQSGDPNSEVRLLAIPKTYVENQGDSRVHNAGDLHFGPDGYLYMSVGDGGPDPGQVFARPADIANNGQRRDVLLGKVLRLDVRDLDPNGVAPDCNGLEGEVPYTIPSDNPMIDGPGGMCDEIWSRGWRNPWRFSFDRVTGDMYVGDVGEERYEEINRETPGNPGLNYGWACYEGPVLLNQNCQSSYVFPNYMYNHDDGSCSIIGGYVYRGREYATLTGQYVFTDFCSRNVWRLPTPQLNNPVTLAVGASLPAWTTIGEDFGGELYFGSYGSGRVFKLTVP
ncbi:MAG: PQQ-dependent sugar dehydrogenase [Anaerolineae bacterium]|nr:PQQ-dependent sugar dehydrogenase [Anaerolineae bacterium]